MKILPSRWPRICTEASNESQDSRRIPYYDDGAVQQQGVVLPIVIAVTITVVSVCCIARRKAQSRTSQVIQMPQPHLK